VQNRAGPNYTEKMSTLKVESDEYCLWVGKIIHAASLAEMYLFSTFLLLTRINFDMARAIYYALDAITAKVGVTRRVAETAKCDQQEMALVDEIIKQVKKANDQRNEFAHAVIATDVLSGDKTRLRLKQLTQNPEPLNRGYLKEKLRLTEAAAKAAALTFVQLVQLRDGQRRAGKRSDASV
jgi:hypothetical protein